MPSASELKCSNLARIRASFLGTNVQKAETVEKSEGFYRNCRAAVNIYCGTVPAFFSFKAERKKVARSERGYFDSAR